MDVMVAQERQGLGEVLFRPWDRSVGASLGAGLSECPGSDRRGLQGDAAEAVHPRQRSAQSQQLTFVSHFTIIVS
jgi:hypothetical protein